MPTRTSLFRRFLSLFSRGRRAAQPKAARDLGTPSEPPSTLYGWQDLPAEVIVPTRQPVVLVQIERRKTAENLKG